MQTLKNIVGFLLIKFMGILPIDNKKIVFKSFAGKYCNESPKAIYDYFLAHYPMFSYVWIMNNNMTKVYGAKVVKSGSLSEIYHLATSKLWVDNSRKGCWVRKRKNQYYIQTWHGSFPIKLCEKDAENVLSRSYIKNAKNDSKMADIILAGNSFNREMIHNSFWYKNTILNEGLPASDVYYKPNDMIKKTICSKYNINDSYNLALYAPTFRDYKDEKSYLSDYGSILKALKKRFGGNWIMLQRSHPMSKLNMPTDDLGHVINVNDYNEISDLIISSDVLISDYSSTIFDAMEARKNVFLYAADEQEYKKSRGFYFELEDLPFSVSRDEEELINNIEYYDETFYLQKAKDFMLKHLFKNSDSSTEKVCKYIEKNIFSR